MSVHQAIREAAADITDELIGWAADLVQIPSVTGDEAAAQKYVADLFAHHGLGVTVLTPDDGLRDHPSFSDDGLPVNRPVVIGHQPGSTANARSLILNGHIDVVPPGDENLYPHGAWSGAVRDDALWGRGAVDMKAGLLAGLAALATLRRLDIQPPGDVWIESVTGEESGGVGTLATVAAGYRADAAVILEPTKLAMCPVGAGSASFRLHVHGQAAHGAMRTEGHSAITSYFTLHRALQELETQRHKGWAHSAFRADQLVAPISVGRVVSGDWPSTVPELLVAEGRYGVLPGESLRDARAEFETYLATVAAEDPWLASHPPQVEWFEGQFEPAETPADAQILQVVAEQHKVSTGHTPISHGVSYGSDLRFFTNDAQMDAVLYGPGDVAVAHTVHEHVPLQDLKVTVEVIANLCAQWGVR